MKIIIATGPIHAFPPPGAAGAQKVFLTLAREFVKKGHRVTVFARSWPGQPAEEQLEGMRIVRADGYSQGTNIWVDLLKDLVYAFKVRTKVPSGDLLITNDFWLPVTVPRSRRGNRRLVVAAHRFPKRQYSLYRHADAFIAVSESVASAICAQEPSLAAKVFTINNPLDSSSLYPSARRPGDTTVIGSLGRIHPEKGVHLLLKAFRLLVERGLPVRLKIAGPWEERHGGGGEQYWKEIRRLAEGLPAEVLGPLENNEIAGFYSSLDVYCLPSLADLGEAMPLAPLEAMACGVVPVVSDIPAFREYIQPATNALVFDHHAKEATELLAAALSELVGDSEKRAKLAAAAVDTSKLFSPAVIADKYLQVFEKVVSGT
jgi:glycosyltransferase involved in cell wall biosynthesis